MNPLSRARHEQTHAVGHAVGHAVLSRMMIAVMVGIGYLPLAWVRALGWLLGSLLHFAAVRRRNIAKINLRLCFPELALTDIDALTRQVFVCFAQAWLDRGWLWHGSSDKLKTRLKLTGDVQALEGTSPVVIFAPHFVGMDAGWTALTQQVSRRFTSIYTDQSNKVMDAWILAGRQRFGLAQLFGRVEGVKTIVASLRQGAPLYLLPDMNFGRNESVFVPFYGIAAATVPSLSRFAKLARARVVPVVTRMTPKGYEVNILPAWSDFPTPDLCADTALMNQRLQSYIDTMPEQYYWVHQRFKDRPLGESKVY